MYASRGHFVNAVRAALGIIVAALLAVLMVTVLAAPAAAQERKLKIGVVEFLSGAAAGTFGVPARNGAETIVNAINAGSIPAPYNTKGMAGAQVEAVYIDEAGSTTKQVEEFRNLVQRQNVDAVVGYIGSGTCLAIAPVAEELKMLTIFNICGTPRIFEDGDYKYVFRTKSHSTMDNVAAAHYVLKRKPTLSSYGAINQNYAWGQDSWRDFKASLELLKPKAKITTEQWPKLFAGQYSSEISALLVSNSEIIHTSLWDGDLEAFIFQANARGLTKRSMLVLTTGENSMFRMGRRMPDGLIVGARGPYGLYARDTALNRWFRQAYSELFTTPPVYPSYMAAQAVLALKIGYDKAAAAKGGAWPTREEVIKAMEYMEYEAFGTTIKLALGKGHQAVTETAYGVYKFDTATGEPTFVDVEYFAAECVNPPAGVNSVEWIQGGLKGAKCK
jgi:branched-chain amino acid transport system substrate-binding protein